MGRKIKAIDSSTGKEIEVDSDRIKSAPIRNTTLAEPLLTRIRDIHERIRGTYDVTLEEFEIPFMRDSDPESEVCTWESISLGFVKVCATLPTLDRKLILRTLLSFSMDSLEPGELADPEVQQVLSVIDAGG